MTREPSVKYADLAFTSVPAFWPMAMATAMFEEGTALYAKNLKFAEEGIKIHNDTFGKSHLVGHMGEITDIFGVVLLPQDRGLPRPRRGR
jgi:hypothetical protein